MDVPSVSDRICTHYTQYRIPMYEVVFKDMGFRLPFTIFQKQIFRWLELAPSQLHPNAFPFMKAFELTCDYLQVKPTIGLFFFIFAIQRSPNPGGGKSWVSFRQVHKLFDSFTDSVRGFKNHFFLIRPKNAVGTKNVIASTPEAEDGTPSSVVPRFSFHWTSDHFKYQPKQFCFAHSVLKRGEKSGFMRLKEFVESFRPITHIDENGNPVLNDEGVPITTRRFINTRSLVTSREPMTVLGMCVRRVERVILLYVYSFSFPAY